MKHLNKALFLAVFFISSMLIGQFKPASAYTFNQTKLIDDALFVDHDSMSVAEIQAFLDSQGTLLANWVDNVDMRRPSDNCIVHHATGMTAAQIIHEAATAWNAQVYDSNGCAIQGAYWGDPGYSNYTLETVSPKALIATLQKEQSLISANGTYSTNSADYQSPTCCSSNEYKLARAMGYGVPDSGGINEKYLGFYNQINWASWQLRFNYERSAGNTTWDNVGYITYSGPMIAGTFKRCNTCTLQTFDGYYPIDGQSIYMGNQSTASLYYYTPHTYPGFFGNYNFGLFYEQWFGSRFLPYYPFEWVSQTPHLTAARSQVLDVFFNYRNTGTEAWYDSTSIGTAPSGTLPLHLATANPVNRTSTMNATWASPNRPAKNFAKVYEADLATLAADQHVVQPGQIGQFRFQLSLSDSHPLGSFREAFIPVADGPNGATGEGPIAFIDVTVAEANYSAAFAGQSGYPTIDQTEAESSFIQFKNTGNVPWFNNTWGANGLKPVNLATSNQINRLSNFANQWVTANRPLLSFTSVYEGDGATLSADQSVVRQGQIGRFSFIHQAIPSANGGFYREWYQLVHEASPNWNVQGSQAFLDIVYNQSAPAYNASFVSQSSYPTVGAGNGVVWSFRLKNTGSQTWEDSDATSTNPVRLATTNPINRTSSFFDPSWISTNRVADSFTAVYESDNSTLSPDFDRVQPGQIVEYSFILKADASLSPGVYREFFQLVREGSPEWSLNGSGVWTDITVL